MQDRGARSAYQLRRSEAVSQPSAAERLIGAILAGLLGCGPGAEISLAERGRRVYGSSCSACHHPDPSRDGTLGPAISGSSRELLEARVLRAEYPPGYRPKRPSLQMTPLPHLAAEIDALTAYLAEAGSAPGR